MNRKYAISPTKSPQLTGGDDRPRPACLGKSEPYDVLIDHTAGPGFDVARRQAIEICDACPLEIAAKCSAENTDEQWVQAMRAPTRKGAAA